MADVKNIITLGIGSAPGNIRHFILVGLDITGSVKVPLTLHTRSNALTLETREGLTLHTRSNALTLEDR